MAARDKVSIVQTFIGSRKMPRSLAKDIVSTFYENVNSNKDSQRIFASLSSSLRVEVAMHISLPLVKSSEVFGACSSGFTTSLSVLMQEMTLTGEETIFRAMEGCAELYIIATNSVNIFSKDPEGFDKVLCRPGRPLQTIGRPVQYVRMIIEESFQTARYLVAREKLCQLFYAAVKPTQHARAQNQAHSLHKCQTKRSQLYVDCSHDVPS